MERIQRPDRCYSCNSNELEFLELWEGWCCLRCKTVNDCEPSFPTIETPDPDPAPWKTIDDAVFEKALDNLPEGTNMEFRRAVIGGFSSKVVGRHRQPDVDPTGKKALEELRNSIQLFDPNDAERVIKSSASLEKEQRERTLIEIQKLCEITPTRPLSVVPDDWKARIARSSEHQPNFADVLESAVAPALAIRAAGGVSRQPPILLVGGPGVGKTHFARRLAHMLRVPSGLVDMSTASTSGELIGLSMKWSNGSSGLLYRLLTAGADGLIPHADPVVVIDELDKASAHRQHMDPIGPLYSLLESQTASRFQDESLPGLYLDASHVRYVICCNSTDGIPRPILSRCQIFNIRELTLDERRKVHDSMFTNIVRNCLLDVFDENLATDILESTLSMNTRDFKNQCLIAVGKAVADKRIEVRHSDFRRETPRARIGFLNR